MKCGDHFSAHHLSMREPWLHDGPVLIQAGFNCFIIIVVVYYARSKQKGCNWKEMQSKLF